MANPSLPLRVCDFLDGIGVNVNDVGDRLGEGWQHVVHRYKEKGRNLVLKYPQIGRDSIRRVLHSVITPKPCEAKRDNDLASEYFGDYVLPTDVRTGNDSELYCMVQEPVAFETLVLDTLEDEPEIVEHLASICECNRRLMNERGLWVDMAGVDIPKFLLGRPYLKNVITFPSKSGKTLRLPDVSLYRGPSFEREGDARFERLDAMKTWYHQRLLSFQRTNMDRFGFDFG